MKISRNFIWVIVLALFGLPFGVDAAVIRSTFDPLDATSTQNVSFGTGARNLLMSVFSPAYDAEVTSISVVISQSGGASVVGAVYDQDGQIVAATTTVTGISGLHSTSTLDIPDFTMNASEWYYILLDSAGGHSWDAWNDYSLDVGYYGCGMWETSGDVYPPTMYPDDCTGYPLPPGKAYPFKYEIIGTSQTDLSATTTRIVSQNSPTNGQTTASTEVTFDFDFYYNSVIGGYDSVGIDLRNVSSAVQYNIATSSILASGSGSYDAVVTLTADEVYMWRPYIVGASGYIYGDWYVFYVVSNPGGSSLYSDPSLSEASSTSAVGAVGTYVRGLFPFSYIDQTADVITQFTSLSLVATTGASAISLPFNSSFGSVATSIPVSLSTVAAFTPIVFMRTIMGYLVYLMFALYAFKKVADLI